MRHQRQRYKKNKLKKHLFKNPFFQIRIAHFEDIKAANEAEAEKFEEQLRNIQKKMQVITNVISSMIN